MQAELRDTAEYHCHWVVAVATAANNTYLDR